MKVLVINSGSSSIKYRLFSMPGEELIAQGAVDAIAQEDATVSQQYATRQIQERVRVSTYHEGIERVVSMLTHARKGPLSSLDEIDACGHRVVHGGDRMDASTIIDEDVRACIAQACELAPLHNPANLTCIDAMQAAMPHTPQVACFDTAFHQTMPEHAYLYALPYEWYHRHKIRRYGFHGTSHRYATLRAAARLEKRNPDLITCHLGSGCSLTAVRNGVSIDTSMGFTPLQGVAMGTRSGDFDPGILFHLLHKGYDAAQLETSCNKQAGLLGLSGLSNDMRRLEEATRHNDPDACRAIDVFAYQVKKYIGAYMAACNGCDAIVCTGGIGEHSPGIRHRIFQGLDTFGIRLDAGKNAATVAQEDFIHHPCASVRVLVVPANEELLIARDTYACTK